MKNGPSTTSTPSSPEMDAVVGTCECPETVSTAREPDSYSRIAVAIASTFSLCILPPAIMRVGEPSTI